MLLRVDSPASQEPLTFHRLGCFIRFIHPEELTMRSMILSLFVFSFLSNSRRVKLRVRASSSSIQILFVACRSVFKGPDTVPSPVGLDKIRFLLVYLKLFADSYKLQRKTFSEFQVVPEEVWDCGDKIRVLDVNNNFIQEAPAEIETHS